MRLGKLTNGIACEWEMQAALSLFLDKKNKAEYELAERYKFVRGIYKYKPRYLIYKDEVRVREVHRIADFLIVKGGRLINIEAKCTDWACLFKQLEDHATYCNYCFAYIPDYAPTPVWFKRKLVDKGYGLIIYNYKSGKVTEVLEAHQNKVSNKELRKQMIQTIRAPKKRRSARRA